MRHFILLAISLLLMTGCATKTVYQINGMPVHDNIVQAKTFNLNLMIKYNLTKHFEVKEDDETYETYEFLPLTTSEIHKIKNASNLIMNVSIFNPEKNEYKIIKYTLIEGGEEEIVDVYDGNISRNNFAFELPLVPNKLIGFYYDAYNKNGNLVFKSFRAQYIIEGQTNLNNDSSNH